MFWFFCLNPFRASACAENGEASMQQGEPSASSSFVRRTAAQPALTFQTSV